MLGYYAERLNAVEINGSFYRTTPASTLDSWAAATPSGFKFCFKANRGVTYSAAAFDKVGLATALGDHLRRLGDRLGPVLVQFPPTRQLDPGLLESILSALGLRAAVEFRHASWFEPAVYGLLREHGAALVVTDEEKWPAAPIIEAPAAYFRLRRDYTEEELGAWLSTIGRVASTSEEVYVFFKHEPEAPGRALKTLAAESLVETRNHSSGSLC
jgi:uncharacterized protein YecE (DUF72 family)